MYLLNIVKATRKMSTNEIKDFIFENCYKRIGFSKENSCYSITIDYPKTSHKLSKTIRKAGK